MLLEMLALALLSKKTSADCIEYCNELVLMFFHVLNSFWARLCSSLSCIPCVYTQLGFMARCVLPGLIFVGLRSRQKPAMTGSRDANLDKLEESMAALEKRVLKIMQQQEFENQLQPHVALQKQLLELEVEIRKLLLRVAARL